MIIMLRSIIVVMTIQVLLLIFYIGGISMDK